MQRILYQHGDSQPANTEDTSKFGFVTEIHPQSIFRQTGEVGYGVYPMMVVAGERRGGDALAENGFEFLKSPGVAVEVVLTIPNTNVVIATYQKYSPTAWLGAMSGLVGMILFACRIVVVFLEVLCKRLRPSNSKVLKKLNVHLQQKSDSGVELPLCSDDAADEAVLDEVGGIVSVASLPNVTPSEKGYREPNSPSFREEKKDSIIGHTEESELLETKKKY